MAIEDLENEELGKFENPDDSDTRDYTFADLTEPEEDEEEDAEEVEEQAEPDIPFGKDLFDEDELKNMISANSEARRAAEFVKRFKTEEPDEPAVIKKKDAEKIGYVKIGELAENTIQEYKTKKTKIELENQPHDDFLKDNFKDFLTMPKISGKNNTQKHNNLIPSGDLNSGSYTEIAADPTTEDISHPSTVEINRSERGEIESIVIYCKCGERTMIKFDYDDNSTQLTTFAGTDDGAGQEAGQE